MRFGFRQRSVDVDGRSLANGVVLQVSHDFFHNCTELRYGIKGLHTNGLNFGHFRPEFSGMNLSFLHLKRKLGLKLRFYEQISMCLLIPFEG